VGPFQSDRASWRFRDGKIYLYRGTEDTAQTQDMLRNS